MKCHVTSITTHDVLVSKDMTYKSYREICSGEPKKVNLGYNNDPWLMKVENNSLLHIPVQDYKFENVPLLSQDWEVLSKFVSIHNIEPNWVDCHYSWGHYDEDLGGWTGCMGKV